MLELTDIMAFFQQLETARKADMSSLSDPIDRGEFPSLMEPMRISASSPHYSALNNLAVELAARSAGLRRSLPPGSARALADLVRSMNCYYSNLIEGHDTHPLDIERALKNDYSSNAAKRDLQLEAKAHIAVQQWIDEGGLVGRAALPETLLEIHLRFCQQLPASLLQGLEPETGERRFIAPGSFRRQDVKVGGHVPVSPGAIHRFMTRFSQVYSELGKADSILAIAAAHHRLLWVHPFLDGNGRVARLMSHAMTLESLDSGGLWSVARGLARQEQAYKTHLARCDEYRRHDFDGRGHLSEEALANFSRFFLETCLDQVEFMEQLVQPERLRRLILEWVQQQIHTNTLPSQALALLEVFLYRKDEILRKELPGLLDVSERHARRVVAALMEQGVLQSNTIRSPLRLAFPAHLAQQWMPGLFPDR